MANKLSVFIPTFNDTKSVKSIINSLDNIAEEFVIFDQSNPQNKNILLNLSKRNKKIKIFNFIPLGYPDPLRSIGLKICKNMWVLIIDVGETLSPDLIKNIPKYINENNVDGYLLRRIDNLSNGSYEIWQTRLFKKNKCLNLGFIHEIPFIDGKIHVLSDKKIFIEEHIDYETNKNKLLRYFKISSYTSRLSYNDIIKISSKRSKIITKILRFYLKLFRKNNNSELNYYEYRVMNLIYLIYLYLSQKEKVSFTGIRFKNWYNSKQFKFFSSTTTLEKELQMEIKNEINEAGGVIKYLSLDKILVINTLYYKLKNSTFKPEDNFINLLILRHKLGSNYFKLIKNDFNEIK